jgi:TerC family integral membrane protein
MMNDDTALKENKPSVDSKGTVSIALAEGEEENEIYKTAIQRTLAWVAAAAAFGTGLFFVFGAETSEEFFAGYLLEQSLSVDNLLVFLLLFDYFKIPQKYQNRVLNWGILGAIVMRAIMIGLGSVALQQFHGVLLAFAAVLLYSSVQILFEGDEDDEDLGENSIVQFSKKLLKSTDEFDGDRFFTMVNGVKLATPMLLCLVAVEVSDVVFAVDSVPAVFGVTEVSMRATDCFSLDAPLFRHS